MNYSVELRKFTEDGDDYKPQPGDHKFGALLSTFE